jgi:hypothetical protein
VTVPPVPGLTLGSRWREARRDADEVRLIFADAGAGTAAVAVRRSANGRLRDTYPLGLRDLEVTVLDSSSVDELGTGLWELSEALLTADPQCRRVVLGVAAGDHLLTTAAMSANYRHAVDVEVDGNEMSLYVTEPTTLTAGDVELDRVPGT